MMYQQISVSRNEELDLHRAQLSRCRRAVSNARIRRAQVQRQRRTLLFTAVALVLGVILTFSVLGTSAQATGADQATESYKYYKEVYVESGDTLWSIAEQYTDGSIAEISACIEQIRSINSINQFETLKAGTYIVVPYYSEEYLH